MITKEISQQIVSSLIGEIPIEYRNGRDQKEIEEEMDAIVADGIDRVKKQTVEKACKTYCKLHKVQNCAAFDECDIIRDFRKALEQ